MASFEHIVPAHPLSWRLTTVAARQFESVWHFHPEFELTYVRRGHGTRLVGDSVGDYAPGSLTLIGPEVPHTYVSTPGESEHVAVVVQFRRDFLGPEFFGHAVFEDVAAMLDGASRGLAFTSGDAPLRRLEELPPAEKTVELLGLLVRLAREGGTPLTSGPGSPALDRATAARVEAMVGLMHARYAARLTLADVAAAAHLTPSSASRLFSRATGSGISIYLNVVRVNAACRLLRDTDLPVAAVAGQCGFSNLSNFNRRFRDVKGRTPREYRAGFPAAPVAAPTP
nr:AraC family transcriptional regulator [Kineococcus siccus]